MKNGKSVTESVTAKLEKASHMLSHCGFWKRCIRKMRKFDKNFSIC